MQESQDLTQRLAEEAVALKIGRLSDADIAHAKLLLLDHIGVALRGATLPWGLSLQELAARYKGTGRAAVYGSDLKTVPAIAALVNATAAHGMELDDTHDASVSHPGAPVIGTALAVGAEAGASGAAVLVALCAGYEVMARVGMATGAGGMIERGFHPTALFGGFGAATAAAKLRGLDADSLVRAWGLMLSMAGGSMQFSQDASGTTVKRLHGGFGAHNGTMAAELAALGIAGPAQAFDGVYGLCNLFGSPADVSRLAKPAGAPLEIHRISLKPYPCCRLFHSTIDALRTVTDDFSLADDDIRAIRVGGPAIMVTQHMLRRPTSVMAAQYSLPFTLGAAIAHGPTEYDAFAEDRLADTRTLAIGDKVEAVQDDAMEAAFPEHFGSWVEITTGADEVRRADVLDSHGTPARPMAWAAVREKADGLLAGFDWDIAAIDSEIGALENAASLDALLTRITRA